MTQQEFMKHIDNKIEELMRRNFPEQKQDNSKK